MLSQLSARPRRLDDRYDRSTFRQCCQHPFDLPGRFRLGQHDRSHAGRADQHEIVLEPCGGLVVDANQDLGYAFVLGNVPVANGIARDRLVVRRDGILQIENHGVGTAVERIAEPVGPVAWYEEVRRR